MFCIKINKSALFAYIAMTISFMSGYSMFYGEIGSPKWNFYYYGRCVILVLLSIYYIVTCKNSSMKKERAFFIFLFYAPIIVMFLYSCIIWLFTDSSFPYISRGISNTIFQCIAYFCGICFTFGEKEKIFKISLSSAFTVFGLSYFIGFLQNGTAFFSAFNPFSPKASLFLHYIELHEIAFVTGLYILLFLIEKRYSNIKHRKIFFCISVFIFWVSWKRIGIASIIFSYLCFFIFNHSKRLGKSYFITISGMVGIGVCIIYVWLVVSGNFIKITNYFDIDTTGRDIIYSYFCQFAKFSPFYFGKGLGFVSRQFDYTTTRDLHNMVTIKALHNDFFKLFIEIGFAGYLLWIWWWLIGLPKKIQKKYGEDKAFICLLFIIYAFILYSTDNTESYFNFQMHLASIITYIACFYAKNGIKNNTYFFWLDSVSCNYLIQEKGKITKLLTDKTV